MTFASLVLIYVPGLLQLNLWLSLVKSEHASIGQVLMYGAVPFIAGDVIKSVAAALIARGVTPKSAYTKK
jgi:biotin transport system substrate-specific component